MAEKPVIIPVGLDTKPSKKEVDGLERAFDGVSKRIKNKLQNAVQDALRAGLKGLMGFDPQEFVQRQLERAIPVERRAIPLARERAVQAVAPFAGALTEEQLREAIREGMRLGMEQALGEIRARDIETAMMTGDQVRKGAEAGVKGAAGPPGTFPGGLGGR